MGSTGPFAPPSQCAYSKSVTKTDQERWDARYRDASQRPQPADFGAETGAPSVFLAHADQLLSSANALELACGTGRTAVWLAINGVDVKAYDVSPVAIEAAERNAKAAGVGSRCHFEVADFDDGLPVGDPVDLVVCHLFRDSRLDRALIDRLSPGGVLAIAALSEVGSTAGRFRCKPGELFDAFSSLELIGASEADGVAWLVGRRSS